MFASPLTIFMHHKIGFINLRFSRILAINFMMEIILAVFVLHFNRGSAILIMFQQSFLLADQEHPLSLPFLVELS